MATDSKYKVKKRQVRGLLKRYRKTREVVDKRNFILENNNSKKLLKSKKKRNGGEKSGRLKNSRDMTPTFWKELRSFKIRKITVSVNLEKRR